MGAWIAGSICMSLVATQNFYTIDRLLAEKIKLALGVLVAAWIVSAPSAIRSAAPAADL
jgi:hypothetical protein